MDSPKKPDTGAIDAPNSQAATARLYRSQAISERASAEAATLPNRAAMHLRSAEVWDDRAKALEDMLAFRHANEASKTNPPTALTPTLRDRRRR